MLNGAAAPAGRRPGAARPGAARRPRGMEPFLGCTGAALLLCFSYAGLRPVEAGNGRRDPGSGGGSAVVGGVGRRDTAGYRVRSGPAAAAHGVERSGGAVPTRVGSGELL